jgi:hypothetical protein
MGGRVVDMFTKADSWKGKNSWFQNFFDPGALVFKQEESTPREKTPPNQEAIAAEAEAREKERRRLSSGSAGNRRADTLSASIGKRVLGGSS